MYRRRGRLYEELRSVAHAGAVSLEVGALRERCDQLERRHAEVNELRELLGKERELAHAAQLESQKSLSAASRDCELERARVGAAEERAAAATKSLSDAQVAWDAERGEWDVQYARVAARLSESESRCATAERALEAARREAVEIKRRADSTDSLQGEATKRLLSEIRSLKRSAEAAETSRQETIERCSRAVEAYRERLISFKLVSSPESDRGAVRAKHDDADDYTSSHGVDLYTVGTLRSERDSAVLRLQVLGDEIASVLADATAKATIISRWEEWYHQQNVAACGPSARVGVSTDVSTVAQSCPPDQVGNVLGAIREVRETDEEPRCEPRAVSPPVAAEVLETNEDGRAGTENGGPPVVPNLVAATHDSPPPSGSIDGGGGGDSLSPSQALTGRVGAFFGSLFGSRGRGEDDSSVQVRAHLGSKCDRVYDDALKRWVRRGEAAAESDSASPKRGPEGPPRVAWTPTRGGKRGVASRYVDTFGSSTLHSSSDESGPDGVGSPAVGELATVAPVFFPQHAPEKPEAATVPLPTAAVRDAQSGQERSPERSAEADEDGKQTVEHSLLHASSVSPPSPPLEWRVSPPAERSTPALDGVLGMLQRELECAMSPRSGGLPSNRTVSGF